MRSVSENRYVMGAVMNQAARSPVIRSTATLPDTATPNCPIPVGMRFIFAFGKAPVPHSSSDLKRLNCALKSTGLPNTLTTHSGEVEPMKSPFFANEAQDSTLQLPGSDTSAVST